MKTDKQHKGQVALVVVLIMTVVSALAVSLASRSTVETRIQQEESNSVQALLLAQTGVEQLIADPNYDFLPGIGYDAEQSNIGSDGLVVGLTQKGSTIEINLVNGENLSGFAVYWGPGILGEEPAVFVSTITDSGGITDMAFDYDGINGFTAALLGTGGYAKTSGTIPLTANDTKVRITVLGADAVLKVLPVGIGASFPSQVVSIRSTGSVPSADTTVKYGLQYDESATDSVPEVFDYALFSGGSIIQ